MHPSDLIEKSCPRNGHYHPTASENKEEFDGDYVVMENEDREAEVVKNKNKQYALKTGKKKILKIVTFTCFILIFIYNYNKRAVFLLEN